MSRRLEMPWSVKYYLRGRRRETNPPNREWGSCRGIKRGAEHASYSLSCSHPPVVHTLFKDGVYKGYELPLRTSPTLITCTGLHFTQVRFWSSRQNGVEQISLLSWRFSHLKICSFLSSEFMPLVFNGSCSTHGRHGKYIILVRKHVATWRTSGRFMMIHRPDDGGSKDLWTSVNIYQTARRNISEDSHLHTRRRDNLNYILV
jgi:hypothetical protein